MSLQPQHRATIADEHLGWVRSLAGHPVSGEVGTPIQPAAEWLGWDAWVSVDPDFLPDN
jgi:hypothetical protein